MKRTLLVTLLLAAWTVALIAQATNIISSGTLPANCSTGNIYIKSGSSSGFYACFPDNTWNGPYPTTASGGAPTTSTYLTEDDETGDLPNARQLVAGSNVTFDTSTPGQLEINASGGGGGGGATLTSTAFGSETSTTAGDADFYTNSYYLSRYSGSAWVPWGPIFAFTQPVSGDFSWVNQGTSTIDTTNGGIALTPEAVNASNSVRLRVKSAPATPYTITAAFLGLALNDGANATGWGLVWRESGTGELITAGIQFTSTGVSRVAGFDWTSPTDGAPTANFSPFTSTQMPVAWLRIADNGTNRITSISADGQHWLQLQSEGRTTHLTADQVGFFAYQSTTATANPIITLVSWKEGS